MVAVDHLAEVRVEDDIERFAHHGQVGIGDGTRGNVHPQIFARGFGRTSREQP
jgi:hypothetical protein